MYYVLTTQNCGKCKNTKNILDKKNIEYEEVDASSTFGKFLVDLLQIRNAGTIIRNEGNIYVEVLINTL